MCQLCSIARRYGQPSRGPSRLPEVKQFSSLIVRDRRANPVWKIRDRNSSTPNTKEK